MATSRGERGTGDVLNHSLVNHSLTHVRTDTPPSHTLNHHSAYTLKHTLTHSTHTCTHTLQHTPKHSFTHTLWSALHNTPGATRPAPKVHPPSNTLNHHSSYTLLHTLKHSQHTPIHLHTLQHTLIHPHSNKPHSGATRPAPKVHPPSNKRGSRDSVLRAHQAVASELHLLLYWRRSQVMLCNVM
jgi:hypothetical protein